MIRSFVSFCKSTFLLLEKPYDDLLNNLFFNILCRIGLVGFVAFWVYVSIQYSSSILFLDHWDFYNAYFEHHSIWEIFAWQHGPHRQGIGFLLTGLIDSLSGWDMQYISHTITVMFVCIAFLYYHLASRLLGGRNVFFLLFLFFALNPTQIFTHTPNISHGAMPALLLVLSGLSFSIQSHLWRSLLLLLLNFNIIFSGFGLFMGLLTPLFFIGDIWYFYVNKKQFNLLIAIGALFLALLSLYIFSIDYAIPHSELDAGTNISFWSYPLYVIYSYGSFFGVKGLNPLSFITGVSIVTCILSVILFHARLLLKEGFSFSKSAIFSKVVLLFSAYSLIFISVSALGRAHFDLMVAQSPRYMSYLVPSIIALLLHVFNMRNKFRKPLTLASLAFILIMTFAGSSNLNSIKYYHTQKEVWRLTYLLHEDVKIANATCFCEIYPNSTFQPILKEKLDYLKKNKLNLYSDFK